jgi:PAS domain S-box-containing protein
MHVRVGDLGAELRERTRRGASIDDVAAVVADLLRRLEERGRPACPLVRVFVTRRVADLPSALRAHVSDADPALDALVLAASRGDVAAWAERYPVVPLTPAALERPTLVAVRLVERLAELGPTSSWTTVLVTDPRGDSTVPDQDFVRAYEITSVFGFASRAPSGRLVVAVAFCSAHLDSLGLRGLELLAAEASAVLTDTREGRELDEIDRLRARSKAFEDLAFAQRAYLAEAEAGARNALEEARAGADRRLAARDEEFVVQEKKARRAQKAILNVIDDLRKTRAQLEARVEARTRRIFEILESTQDSFVALDRDFRIEMVNRNHEALSGTRREDSVGRVLWDVFAISKESKYWTEYHRARDEGVPVSFVEYYEPLDRWTEVSATPTADRGLAVFYRDVSARKRLEIEREDLLARERRARIDAAAARAQAEDANRLKDEFLSTVSHELRTPLNAILGWATMLRGRPLDDAKRAAAIETIERNARAQVRLIEDLLDLGRILQGKFRLALGPVEVVPLVEGALDSLRPAADAKGVRLQCALDSHATVLGDGERIQQIAWNLVSNAIKFTPRDGRVHVSLRRAPSYVELVVADTGQGIAPEFLPHVFEPFRQADGAISRRAGGLGLGLSIVRSLVELHGGTVTATSDGPGLGSTFAVRIPTAPVRAAPNEHASSRPSDANASREAPPALVGLRLLLVDDEKDTLEMLAFMLGEFGADIVTASSADEAYACVLRERFDLVLSDVGMPGEDGYSLMRKLRKLPPERGGLVPALALTAYARTEDRTQALKAGFTAHLAKPIDPAELTLTIAALVRQPRE